MEHGKVIIKAELTTKQFDKQIEKVKSDIEDLETFIEAEKKLGINTAELEKAESDVEKLRNKLVSLQKQREKVAKQEIPSEFIPDIDVSGEKKEVQDLVLQLNQLKFAYDNINKQTLWTDDDVDKLDNIEEKAKELIKQLEKLTGKKWQIEGFGDIAEDLDDADKKTKNLGKGLESVVKKVGKWALAVFGVRSAYSAIRSAMSTLSQYDDTMASNLDYIKYALANTIKPLIDWILNAVVKLLQYVNYIYKAWTGKNLFKTADAFKNAQKNAQGLNKELQKTTAGFDEINTVSSQSSSSTSGVSTPSVDLTELPEGEIPGWVEAIKNFGQWVIDNWQTVIAILLGIGAVIVIFELFSKTSKNMVPSITKGANAFLKFAGLALVLASFALVLHEIADLITAFSESGLELNDVLGLLGSAFLIIIGLMASIVLFGPAMTAGLAPFSVLMGEIVILLGVMAFTLPTILDAVGSFIQQTAPSLCMVLTTIGNLIKDIILVLGTTLPPIIREVGGVFNTIFNGVSKVINSVGTVIVNIMNTANRLVNSVLSAILNFINKLGPAINNFVDNAIVAVTKLINFMVSGIEYLINTLVISSVNSFIKGLNKLIPGSSFDLKTISNVKIGRFRPQLAKGGIINQPGRGVPVGYGQAIGGEKGQEGVLPLTDSQQMTLLGEAIGRYVNINLTNVTKLDNRQIAKEQRRINAQNDFAFNR